MATVQDMQLQLAALQKARASGVRKVEANGMSTEYKSDAEMATAIADLERRLAGATSKPVRTVYFNSSKGV